jgi:SH3 domain-containing YSC84-like protein 1
MKTTIAVFVALALCGTARAATETKEVRQLQKATNVVDEIMTAPDKGIPQDLLNKAVCVGIVPSDLRAAFVVGGEYGRGVLVCRKNGNGHWGAPSLFTLGGANVGFQLGGKATDVVFLVMNAAGAKKLVRDGVKLGADASATAGPVGRTAEGATDIQLHAEILSYSRTRGLFAGVSLEGAVLHQDSGDNERLYGRKVDAKDLLINGTVSAPSEARPLDETLAKYSPRGGTPFTKA